MTTERRPFTAEYSAYTAAGGPLSYESWQKAGRPKPRGGTPAPTPPTPSAPGPPEAPPWYEGLGGKVKGILPKLPWEALPPPWGAVAGLARPTVEAGLEGQWPWQQSAEAAAPMEFGPGFYEALGRMPTGIREQFPGAPPPTIPQQAAAAREAEVAAKEALGGLTEPPEFPTTPPVEGYRWEYDSASGRYVLEPLPGAIPPAEMSGWQREQIRLAEEEATREAQQRQQERAWEKHQWEAQQQQWQQQQAQQQQQWQQQYGLQQEQMQWQQQQAEAQERARLMASPQSWLQYHAYTGEMPAVQPWMQPLMPQQYQQLGAGQAIPGWSAEGGQAMPQLTQPSRQYQARMGPTAMGQWLGYRQARTGARPEETLWRAQQTAPPGGRQTGLRWTR